MREDIPAGWQITVVTSFTFPCVFNHATEQELVCAQVDRRGYRDDSEVHVRRDRIREIRAERRTGANMLAGAAGAGTVGAGLGAVLGGTSKGRPALLLGLIGARMGARTGQDIHILQGKVIYRKP